MHNGRGSTVGCSLVHKGAWFDVTGMRGCCSRCHHGAWCGSILDDRPIPCAGQAQANVLGCLASVTQHGQVIDQERLSPKQATYMSKVLSYKI